MKKYILQIITLISLLTGSIGFVPAVTYAVTGATTGTTPAVAATTPGQNCPTDPTDPKTQILKGISQTGGDCTDTKVNTVIQTAVSLLSYIAGVAAVIMIIVASFKFITANGDSGNISSARSTLVYALIGIAVAALAQFFVKFVLSNSVNP